MTRKTLSVLLLGISLALASCESDEVTNSSSTQRKLEVIPTYLDAEQYDICTLKARVTNIPFSDAYFHWDFDGGQDKSNYLVSWIRNVMFVQNKIHTVTVKAFEVFTDVFIDSATIRVDVRPPIAFVELSPDTIIKEVPAVRMKPDGSITGPEQVSISFKFSVPAIYVEQIWDWGDGTSDTKYTGTNYQYHDYPRIGTYRVILQAKESGRYLGADTSIAIVRPANVLMFDLENALSTDVYLSLDSNHPIAQEPSFSNPFMLRILGKHQDVTAEFDAAHFSLLLDKDADLAQHDKIIGTVNNDCTSIESLLVAVDESNEALGKTLRYSFELNDLELLAVTSTQIIYRSASPVPDQFMKNLTFNAENMLNTAAGQFPAGTPLNVTTVPGNRPGPYAVIVFNK